VTLCGHLIPLEGEGGALQRQPHQVQPDALPAHTQCARSIVCYNTLCHIHCRIVCCMHCNTLCHIHCNLLCYIHALQHIVPLCCNMVYDVRCNSAHCAASAWGQPIGNALRARTALKGTRDRRLVRRTSELDVLRVATWRGCVATWRGCVATRRTVLQHALQHGVTVLQPWSTT
jgi:hypothetical protein